MSRRHFSFYGKAARSTMRNHAAKAESAQAEGKNNFTPATAAEATHPNKEADGNLNPAGVIPSPEDMSDTETKIIGNAFLETIQREMAKRQIVKPEPPTIDV
jgi:hypothetical protein